MTTTGRERAVQWAREVLARDDLLVLDTETTGLDRAAQIVQIAIIDRAGAVLLDSLVKPTCPIGLGAAAIHGITAAMVQDAPSFAALLPAFRALVAGKRLVIYNADFDMRLLRQSATACGVALPRVDTDCVMHAYAQFVGRWNSRRGGYRWWPLPGGDHSALGDARACLAVIRRMAGES